eukprot:CAMPEP_0175012684 /NCGR_PEP_ID=MMETSP0005-20121125/9450_1 /TAXON_ID=420556 /ORGANISM="Ochromonas sp., Strain CCMP1393" /LENGTH=1047 /DNA_ID=CAMNT_0016268957 /DNA_START=9 /DNA_END=3152 /DNA_ORIENTATION=-
MCRLVAYLVANVVKDDKEYQEFGLPFISMTVESQFGRELGKLISDDLDEKFCPLIGHGVSLILEHDDTRDADNNLGGDGYTLVHSAEDQLNSILNEIESQNSDFDESLQVFLEKFFQFVLHGNRTCDGGAGTQPQARLVYETDARSRVIARRMCDALNICAADFSQLESTVINQSMESGYSTTAKQQNLSLKFHEKFNQESRLVPSSSLLASFRIWRVAFIAAGGGALMAFTGRLAAPAIMNTILPLIFASNTLGQVSMALSAMLQCWGITSLEIIPGIMSSYGATVAGQRMLHRTAPLRGFSLQPLHLPAASAVPEAAKTISTSSSSSSSSYDNSCHSLASKRADASAGDGVCDRNASSATAATTAAASGTTTVGNPYSTVYILVCGHMEGSVDPRHLWGADGILPLPSGWENIEKPSELPDVESASVCTTKVASTIKTAASTTINNNNSQQEEANNDTDRQNSTIHSSSSSSDGGGATSTSSHIVEQVGSTAVAAVATALKATAGGDFATTILRNLSLDAAAAAAGPEDDSSHSLRRDETSHNSLILTPDCVAAAAVADAAIEAEAEADNKIATPTHATVFQNKDADCSCWEEVDSDQRKRGWWRDAVSHTSRTRKHPLLAHPPPPPPSSSSSSSSGSMLSEATTSNTSAGRHLRQLPADSKRVKMDNGREAESSLLETEASEFVLLWEAALLQSLNESLQKILVDKLLGEVKGMVKGEVLKFTPIPAVQAAASLPLLVLNKIKELDDPWCRAMDRAQQAGKLLAKVLLAERSAANNACSVDDGGDSGSDHNTTSTSSSENPHHSSSAANACSEVHPRRPVTLVGYGVGARLIFHCLETLAEAEDLHCKALRERQCTTTSTSSSGSGGGHSDATASKPLPPSGKGIVENVVLIGTPVSSSRATWRRVRTVVAGRLINAYSRNDWMLALLYRSKSYDLGIAGLYPIHLQLSPSSSSSSSSITTNRTTCTNASNKTTATAVAATADGETAAEDASSVTSTSSSSSSSICVSSSSSGMDVENIDLSPIVHSHSDYPQLLPTIISLLKL